MLKRLLAALVVLALLAGAIGLWFTRAAPADPQLFAGLTPDAEHGEWVFWAGGCASCHAAEKASGEDRLVLSGGQRFPSEFGTFVAPNISTDPEHGIGGWSLEDFASAVTRGVSPEGTHYYPAFPYAAYIRMAPQDVVDLKAFMDTLPPSNRADAPHEIGFPFTIRRGIGLWKQLYLTQDWVVSSDLDTQRARGRYLVEALSHCGECHTPRTALGGLDTARWMGGAPNPSGRGTIPNLTPADLEWSAGDIAYYLETGFTPDFDSAGGHMVSVIANMGQLAPEDRQAIAAYVKELPPVATADGS